MRRKQDVPRSVVFRSMLRFVLMLAWYLAAAAPVDTAAADPLPPPAADDRVRFEIPAQPLARALEAYGAATGLDIFYNAAFAEGRRSAAVRGYHSPARALQLLLSGTGYAPSSTGFGAVTIVPASREAARPVAPLAASLGPYEPYFAAIQTAIDGALCRDADLRAWQEEAAFRIWLAPSGTIARAEPLHRGRRSARADLSKTLKGVSVGAPPPVGMPQPVSLVVFPPSEAGAFDGCRPAPAPRITGEGRAAGGGVSPADGEGAP